MKTLAKICMIFACMHLKVAIILPSSGGDKTAQLFHHLKSLSDEGRAKYFENIRRNLCDANYRPRASLVTGSVEKLAEGKCYQLNSAGDKASGLKRKRPQAGSNKSGDTKKDWLGYKELAPGEEPPIGKFDLPDLIFGGRRSQKVLPASAFALAPEKEASGWDDSVIPLASKSNLDEEFARLVKSGLVNPVVIEDLV